MSVDAQSLSSFRFDGRSFVGLVLSPKTPFDDWLSALDDWIGRSWIFTSRPIIIDFSKAVPTRTQFTDLLAKLRERSLRVVAVEGVDQEWLSGLPGLGPGGIEAVANSDDTNVGNAETGDAKQSSPGLQLASAKPSGLLIENHVRSGQVIAYPDGDVTVLGSISSGAEIVAGGSIHVYGTLRGRAIAGNEDNPRARLFCRRFEPELVAINGLYCTAEEVDPALLTKPVQAWLEGGTINMSIID